MKKKLLFIASVCAAILFSVVFVEAMKGLGRINLISDEMANQHKQ